MLQHRQSEPSKGPDPDLTVLATAMRTGRYRNARAELDRLEQCAPGDPHLLLRLAECRTHLGDHRDAERLCAAAQLLAPRSPEVTYALANARLAVGQVDSARTLYDETIAVAPEDWDAWVNRSTLGRATSANNHVAQLHRARYANPRDPAARVALGYALARELEDLGLYREAFEALDDAAAARRRQLSYRVDEDVATMLAIRAAFDADALAHAPAAVNGPGPIFILGLPRSGSTLVDRILSMHPQVESLGELQDFSRSLMDLAGPATDKLDLVRRSMSLDHRALGREYLRRVSELGTGRPHPIDKTPLNALYVGLIAMALPEARIVHVRRGALDGCYAMFKTLFRMGYPFSYALDDLIRYRAAHETLMAHWRRTLPGRMIEIDYEALVADQRGETKRLLAECGLPWHEACLDFTRNDSPVATASAAQVREPLHDRSIGLWRRYEQQLQPLADGLRQANVHLEWRA